MLSSTLLKIGGGLAIIGSATTASYFISDYYNTERIYHQINNSGKTLLTSYDKEWEWVKRWKEYLGDNRNLWKLPDYDTVKQNKEKVPNSFKNKCTNNSSLAIEDNENLAQQIENWCTKSFKVSSLFGKGKGFELLTDNDEAKVWKDTWNDYLRKHSKTHNPLNIDRLSSYSANGNQEIPSDYKNKCNAAKDKEIRTLKDAVYNATKNWCAKKSK